MPYYHDEPNRTVVFAPEVPESNEKKDKRGGHVSWTIWAQFDITRADNYIDPKTHQWAHPVRSHPREVYDYRDDLADSIRYFKIFHYPRLPEITYEEYSRLRAEYGAIAERNTPPG